MHTLEDMHCLDEYCMEIDSSSLPADRMVGYSILHSLPPEIFEKICMNLEPVWLMNLSITCYAMSVKLSVEVGNRIWYNVMPPSVWQEAEGFQDEEELCALWMRKHSPEHLSQTNPPIDVYQFALTPDNVPANVAFPNRSVRAFPHTTSDQREFSVVKQAQDVYLLNGSYQFGVKELVYSSLSREHVQALGGPYQPCFNYRRELIGRFHSRQHCYICFTRKDTEGREVSGWMWNMLICPECIREYTISDAAIRELRVTSLNTLSDWVVLTPCTLNRVQRYFLPEIDVVLRFLTGLNFRANIVKIQEHRHMTQMGRLEISRLEYFRRSARLAIVHSAQKIWEGIDPAAGEEQRCLMNRSRRHDCMPTANTFRFYRERWAPTSKLAEFLFPPYSLSESPTQVPLNSDKGYMNDPTMVLRKVKDISSYGFPWVVDKALQMLEDLVVWDHPRYRSKGYGGYVSTWVEAATKYHMDRMERNLVSGATANMEYVHLENQGARQLRCLRNMREKSGLEFTPIPVRPERGSYLNQHTFEEYVRLDREAVEMEHKRACQLATFNKLIRHTSHCCPISSWQCYPIGFEGLVDHMRLHHPTEFWSKDDWNTIG